MDIEQQGLAIGAGPLQASMEVEEAMEWAHRLEQGRVSLSYRVEVAAQVLSVILRFSDTCRLRLLVAPALRESGGSVGVLQTIHEGRF